MARSIIPLRWSGSFTKNRKLMIQDGISIIMPAYNEEECLRDSVKSAVLAAQIYGADYEVLIVNDGSKETPHNEAIDNSCNLGMGGAFKTGLHSARFSHVILFAADSEHNAESVAPILSLRGSADMIIPYVENPEIRPSHRQFISNLYTWLINKIFFQEIPYYNGLVLYKTEQVRKINIKTNSFSFQTEAILKLLKVKATWTPVACSLQKGNHKKTKAFRIKNVIGVIWTILRLRISM